jgi:outer membrane protein OmpA-like peptidoglycan-associated protein
MKKKEFHNFFWPSYADLMTSLFFIMLVLYVLTFLKLKFQQKATVEQLNKIKEIQKSVKELPEKYFQYQPEYKRFTITQQIQFEKKQSIINPGDYEYLLGVGKSIKNLIAKLKRKYPNDDIRYLLVIEGMASNDSYDKNYELSYERAFALFKFWRSKGIVFDEKICEVQIAGSGIGGTGRYANGEEFKNQRFLIQIVPKIGNIKIDE